MATLTTSQKAPLIVADENGTDIDANHRLSTVEGTAVTLDSAGVYVYGQEPGIATITVTSAGQTGTLEVTVTPAPLTVTLGPVEAK